MVGYVIGEYMKPGEDGELRGYLGVAQEFGKNALNAAPNVYRFFNEAGAWPILNRAYLNAQIFANQQVYLSDAPAEAEPGSGFAMEIQHLVSRGIGPDQWKFLPNRFHS
jgi:hypothetical protein